MKIGQICILIDGINNVNGQHALELKEYFNLVRYPNQEIGTDYYYLLFNNNLNPRDEEIIPTGIFTEFMIYLGLRSYAFRLDRVYDVYGDADVDYVMKIGNLISQLSSMPKNLDGR